MVGLRTDHFTEELISWKLFLNFSFCYHLQTLKPDNLSFCFQINRRGNSLSSERACHRLTKNLSIFLAGCIPWDDLSYGTDLCCNHSIAKVIDEKQCMAIIETKDWNTDSLYLSHNQWLFYANATNIFLIPKVWNDIYLFVLVSCSKLVKCVRK